MRIGKKLVLLILMLFIGVCIYHKEVLKLYYPMEYSSEVKMAAEENGLDEYLIYAVIKNESGFRETVESPRGAKGLMQIMPSTADWIQSIKDFGYDGEEQLLQGEKNIAMGSWYLKNLIDEFHDVEKAVAAYNAGRGNVAKWLENKEYCNDDQKLIFIPFKETDVYLKRVMFSQKMYRYIYGD